MIKIRIYWLLLTVILHTHLWAASYFVTPQGAGSKSGDSWGNAMGTGEFSLKLISASQGDIFYLSEGNYNPTLDKTGTASQTGAQTFRLLPGVSIYGSYKTGLTGTASAESDRNLKNASGELSPSTIFDGEGNAYMIIDAQNAGITPTPDVTLNGLTVTGSRMSAIYVEKSGLNAEYCQVTDNNLASETYVGSVNGAAIYVKDATTTLSNSDISGNKLDGGGMGTSAPVWVENGVLNIVNSLISDNESTNGGTPAILLENSTGNIINSTISGNESDNPALGAVTVGTSSHLNIISSTLTDNTAGVSLMYDGTTDATLKIDNTIVSGNDKDLVLYKDNFGTAQTNSSITANGDILSSVSPGSNTPVYSIIGSDLYNNSYVGTDVGFDAATDLGPLKYNGGDTKTHALLDTDNNPAFQKGNPAYAGTSGRTDGLEKDQRGETRLTPPCIGAYDGKEKVALNIKIFLQGPLQADGKMTNYIQTADGSYSAFVSGPKLPHTDPYGLGYTYDQINDLDATGHPTGIVGEVVDWVRVEIWKADLNTYTKEVKEVQALLLKPDGSVVDTSGNVPLFDAQDGEVIIVVKHRNHVPVLSNPVNNFKGVVNYDFTSSLGQALTMSVYDLPQMVLKYGQWCLWSGNFDDTGSTTDNDYSMTVSALNNYVYDQYMKPDVNMNGYMDDEDFSIISYNVKSSIYSVIIYFP